MIKVNLGSRRGIKLKMDLGLVRSKLRRVVVLKMVSLHVLLVERGTIGNLYLGN